jgi:septal ring factor EnvC (AmiA/AmiB activator)
MVDTPDPVPARRRGETHEKLAAMKAEDRHIREGLAEIKAIVREEMGSMRAEIRLLHADLRDLDRQIGALAVTLERTDKDINVLADRLSDVGQRVTVLETARAEESKFMARAPQALQRAEHAVTRKQAGWGAAIITAITAALTALAQALGGQ